MKKKLRSRKGMTLAEVLISLLILGLMTAGVSAGVSSSLNVYRESTQYSEAQMLSSILAEAVINELRFASNITGTNNPTFTRSNGTPGQITTDSTGYIKVNDNRLLVSKGSYCGKFTAAVNYSYSAGQFSVLITVNDTDGNFVYATPTITVVPLNP